MTRVEFDWTAKEGREKWEERGLHTWAWFQRGNFAFEAGYKTPSITMKYKESLKGSSHVV